MRRNIVYLVLIALLIGVFSACANDPEDASSLMSSEESSENVSETVSETTENVKDVNFDFYCFDDMSALASDDAIFNIGCAKKTENGETIFVFNSKEDIANFIPGIPHSCLNVIEYLNDFSDSYFEEKTIFVSIFFNPTDGYMYELESVVKENETLNFEYTYKLQREVVNCAITEYYCIVEVPKNEIDGCEKYIVERVFDAQSLEE